MRTYGLRDIIGPVMIGPSSSHTAGALRISAMARRLLSAEPASVVFTLYGSFAKTYQGHGTDRALLAGLLGLHTDDMRIRDSFLLAEEAGLTWEFITSDAPTDHSNTVDIIITDKCDNQTTVRGESIGGGAACIRKINGIEVELTGTLNSLVVKQQDVKGVLAAIATTVTEANINIATTRLFRERRGAHAYTVMETDEAIPQHLVTKLEGLENILSVSVLPSDAAVDPHAPISVQQAQEEGIEPTGFGVDLTPEAATELFENVDFASAADLLAYCETENTKLSDAICVRERCLLASRGIIVNDTKRYLSEALLVMRESVQGALHDPRPSMGGLIGGEAVKLQTYADGQSGSTSLADPLLAKAITYAMAVLETNASMGRIVAAPTAGASGVLPAVLFAIQDVHGIPDERLERAIANAGAVGLIVTRNATVAGAEGGCQAEVGTASAMAASAAVELMGGTPAQCFNAAAIALTGLMGLVCDPIGGLVEAPCQKRNATGAANALTAAQLALAGVSSLIDFDETVAAMDSVGRSLPFELRESALGGLAATPTACALCAKSRDNVNPYQIAD